MGDPPAQPPPMGFGSPAPPPPGYPPPPPGYPPPPPGYPPPYAPAVYLPPVRPCPSCGQHAGADLACQYCNQVLGLPLGVRLSSPGRRFGGALLTAVLIIGTLLIGYLVWSLVIWQRGQTPAKQLLGMRVLSVQTGRRADWGTMALRGVVGKFLCMGVINTVSFGVGGLVLAFMLFWNPRRQELWDRIAQTIVVDDPQGQL